MTGVGARPVNVGRLYVLKPGEKTASYLPGGHEPPSGCSWWKVIRGVLVATNHKLWMKATGHPFRWDEAAKLMRLDPTAVPG